MTALLFKTLDDAQRYARASLDEDSELKYVLVLSEDFGPKAASMDLLKMLGELGLDRNTLVVRCRQVMEDKWFVFTRPVEGLKQ